jgi:hypothetical protein
LPPDDRRGIAIHLIEKSHGVGGGLDWVVSMEGGLPGTWRIETKLADGNVLGLLQDR